MSKIKGNEQTNNNGEIFRKIKGNKILINPIIINYKTVRVRKSFPMQRRIVKLGAHSSKELSEIQNIVDVEVNDILVDKLFLMKQKYSMKAN